MNELTQLGRSVGELLKAHGETVSVTESSAGGLISAALLATPGASAYFRGGAVCYTREARKAYLDVDAETLSALPPSTEAVALAMARAARQRLGTTWAVGETGAAGPTGSRYGYEAGHAVIAVSGPIELSATIETRTANRELNMWSFASAALDLLQKALTHAHGKRN
jgi:nicotinamide-nucleotide amidase